MRTKPDHFPARRADGMRALDGLIVVIAPYLRTFKSGGTIRDSPNTELACHIYTQFTDANALYFSRAKVLRMPYFHLATVIVLNGSELRLPLHANLSLQTKSAIPRLSSTKQVRFDRAAFKCISHLMKKYSPCFHCRLALPNLCLTIMFSALR